MGEAVEKSRKIFLQSQIGKESYVLFETKAKGGYFGYTENYTPVLVYSDDDIRGEILKVKIRSCDGELAEAEVIYGP